MSPAATAFEAPSHLRVRSFTKTKGSAPIPVATAVSNAKRKTWAGAVTCIRFTLVAPARSSNPTGCELNEHEHHDNHYLPTPEGSRRRAGRSSHMSARPCIVPTVAPHQRSVKTKMGTVPGPKPPP